MKNDVVYLRHILDAIEKIETYLKGATYESFSSNDMMIDAVVRELEIIGEASSNLTEEFRRNHPDVMWRDAIDMRNFLIHEYFGVRTQMVWDTCQNDIPALKSFVETALND
jgi:uncharacterized protein with HEPN domain